MALCHSHHSAHGTVVNSAELWIHSLTHAVPVLVLRETTERPEAVQAGTAKLIGTNPQTIVDSTAELLENPTLYRQMATAINPFGDGQASARIVKIARDYLLR